MPHNVEIKVYLLAKSQVTQNGPHDWLDGLGVSDSAQNRILLNHSSAERIVEMAGRRCYKSFEVGLNPNVEKIREDITEYIDNILKVGHGSVLEHVTFTFAIENVSRVFTGEMNRHRAGMAISEGSMRFIRYEDIPYWIPISIRDHADDDTNTLYKKLQSRIFFGEVFLFVEQKYAEIAALWKHELSPESKFKAKKEITSMMRRIIPMGVATGGIWTGNLRALRHIFEMRCSPAAEEEILLVATKMLNVMQQEEPRFFGDFNTGDNGFSAAKYKKV